MSEESSRQRTIVTPVVVTMPADLLTPLAVYLKLSARHGDSFLLESVEGGRSLARYSFIGAGSRRVVGLQCPTSEIAISVTLTG
ncbi:MAG: hypothetical protein JNL64_04425 [Blastocatellia bacterium]|nr:hypothetical protein [Blastocatellia bacterium]